MSKRSSLSCLFTLCLIFYSSIGLFAKPLTVFSKDTLAFEWTVSAITDVAGNSKITPSYDDRMLLGSDGRFSLTVRKDSISQAGWWTLRNDSLVLLYEFIPVAGKVDSIVYEAKGQAPMLSMYSEGEKIAWQSLDGLESKRREKRYAVEIHENSNITLTANDEVISLGGRAPMIKSGFSINDLLRGTFGIFLLLFIAFLFSKNRKAIDWRLVISGVLMQLGFAALVLKVPAVKIVFEWFAGFFVQILNFTSEGAQFLFGSLITDLDGFGYIFAFQVLPTIVFFSALTSLLYYLRILQGIVFAFAWLMSKTMRLSGAESLAAAGNIFLGQTESPLLVKPYLANMTRSEIMCLMTGGMATIAGGVFAAYIGYLGGTDPIQQQLFATHLLTASIMSAPAAIVAAKILVPETEQINQDIKIPEDKLGSNVLDAISKGTVQGLKLAVNVGVMLLVFIAMIDMVNYFFADLLGNWTGINGIIESATDGRYKELSLQYIFGLVFSPLAWALGVPSSDMVVIGQLLGEKTIINEFVAYTSLGTAKTGGLIQHYKSLIIGTYALCGFANFASIGIQIGGIGTLAPNQWKTLSELGIRALIGGSIAAFMTAAIAGMMISI